MRLALFPVLDPFTMGHLDIEICTELFDKVIVAVDTTVPRRTLFP